VARPRKTASATKPQPTRRGSTAVAVAAPSTESKGASDEYVQTREAIVRAAAEVFSRDGFRAGTTKDIAAKVGLSQPSLYYCVGAKEALLSELALRLDHDMAATLDQPRERLEASIRELTAAVMNDTTLFAVYWAEARFLRTTSLPPSAATSGASSARWRTSSAGSRPTAACLLGRPRSSQKGSPASSCGCTAGIGRVPAKPTPSPTSFCDCSVSTTEAASRHPRGSRRPERLRRHQNVSLYVGGTAASCGRLVGADTGPAPGPAMPGSTAWSDELPVG